MDTETPSAERHTPCKKGKLVGQKPPLKLREIWAIRTRVQIAANHRELAIFNVAIDSKLRAGDLTRQSLEAWIEQRDLRSADYLFPSRLQSSQHLSTRRLR